jgi:hypothetical protein
MGVLMDKTEKLLHNMIDLAGSLRGDLQEAVYLMMDAQVEYEFLTPRNLADRDGAPNAVFAREEWNAEEIEQSIKDAALLVYSSRAAIVDFDKLLLKLIHLRGKLAEEIDLPIGGERWVRTDEYAL